MQNDSYPETVAEVLDESQRFKPAALAALRSFKESHPWRGTLDERQQKFKSQHISLCKAYSMDPMPRLILGNGDESCSGSSAFFCHFNAIVLRGRLSVLTYLHEFAHARGMGEHAACHWSLNLFRRVWPKLFVQCQHDGHMLRLARHSSR